MTERIDLDDVEVDDPGDEASGNDGDWLWRDEGAPDPPDSASEPSGVAPESASEPTGTGRTGNAAAEREDRSSTAEADAGSDGAADRVPHVPHANRDRPVGIPQEGGGAGGAPAAEAEDETADAPRSTGEGPHGGGVDDVTMAMTYDAARRLAAPARVFASAAEWCDWIGVVGDVPAHVVQKFQRDAGVDADFFNGSGTGPGERLAEVDRNSMFYAERMVVVGVEEADESIAAAADWEFVPLSEAAAAADWELE